jgi:hypothetical protein
MDPFQSPDTVILSRAKDSEASGIVCARAGFFAALRMTSGEKAAFKIRTSA